LTPAARVSEWNAATHAQLEGNYYWNGKPLAYYTTAADTSSAVGIHFEHQNYLGTERMRTMPTGPYNSSSPNYAVEASFADQPFGDNKLTIPTGAPDTDANHYAFLDTDKETATDHADFRQYSNAQGRWMAPDPYDGSYNPFNPQSLNRYVYAMNSPLSAIDPSGLDCVTANGDGTITTEAGDCPGNDPNNEYYLSCDGCLNGAVGGYMNPTGIGLIVVGADGEVLGVVGDIDGFGYTAPDSSQDISINFSSLAWVGVSGQGPGGGGGGAPNNGTPVHGLWTYGHWCGSGGSGNPTDPTDAACMAHDACYAQAGFTAGSNFQGSNAQLQACNQQLCNAVRARQSSLIQKIRSKGPLVTSVSEVQEPGADGDINSYFTWAIAPWGNSCH
jgi:RHS repeat-associated protein